MDLMETLRQEDHGAGIDGLARSFGLTREQADAAVAAVLPEIARRLERNTLSRGGVADLLAMMGQVETAPSEIGSEAARAHGNALLEQVLGTRDNSRALAARAASSSGIGASIIQAMLPYIIQMVMGSLLRRTSGGLGDILSKIPGLGGPSGDGDRSARPTSSRPSAGYPLPAPGSWPDSMPSSGGRGGELLPGPEGMAPPSRNPYGDLSDIVRRGGRDTAVEGSPLWRTIRNVLGSALGFQSRGVVGWILRMIVMRYGWRILQTILRRAFTGR